VEILKVTTSMGYLIRHILITFCDSFATEPFVISDDIAEYCRTHVNIWTCITSAILYMKLAHLRLLAIFYIWLVVLWHLCLIIDGMSCCYSWKPLNVWMLLSSLFMLWRYFHISTAKSSSKR